MRHSHGRSAAPQRGAESDAGGEHVLYLAHCTFKEDSSARGDFTFLAQCEDPQDALERLRAEVTRAGREAGLFDGRVRVYLEHFLEVNQLPDEGVIVRYQMWERAKPPAVVCAFPAGRPGGCLDLTEPDDENDRPAPAGAEPFLKLGPA